MNAVKYIFIMTEAYLLGSVSISIVLSSLVLGGDVRDKGSGNAGATNMARTYGWSAGFITLGGDMLKTIIAMAIGLWLMSDKGLCVAGIAAMLGHCYPIFYGFKGGKGISVLAAVAIMLDWRIVVLGLAAFLIVAFITKKVSPGSLTAAIAVPALAVVFSLGTPKIVLATVSGALVIYRHRSNIKRLMEGTEPNFHAAKK